MKKFLLMITAVLFSLVIGFSSCTSCNGNKEVPATDSVLVDTTNAQKAELVVENLVSMDRQDMYTNYGKDYRWFETCIVMKDYLDAENDGTIAGVSNIFQIVEGDGKSFDTKVIMFTHTPDTAAVEVKNGFWVEDFPLNDEAIKVTFKQAFDNLMATNCPKPHSKHCVLRKEVGPKEANPQYIFGNQTAQVYVDATTGEVKTSNPAFPESFSYAFTW